MPPSADAADRGTPHAAAAGWRLLGVERGEPAALLARGLELLDGLSPGDPPVLRWYVPSAPALVLGRGQRDTDVRTDLPVARRHSGGGAVLMDADLLSLDVVFPAGHPMAAGDLGEAFLRVGEAWAAVHLQSGDAEVAQRRGASPASRLGGPRERLLAAVCYALPGRGEVLHGGRKLVGLAQRRRRHGTLVQCGLLWRWRPAALLAALGADPDDAQVHAAAVGLADLVDPAPAQDDVVAAVERRMTRDGRW